MTKTPWIAGVALAATFAASAFAAPPADGPPGPPRTRAELQAKIAEHFRQADTNGDGVITAAERDAAREAMKAKWQERRAERKEQRFAELDTDRNGSLSKAEFLAPRAGRDDAKDGREGRGPGKWSHSGHHGGGFGRMGMGMGGGQWFERADANKDGKLTLAEAQAGPLATFDKVDANKDGVISPEEHKAARDAMRAKWQERHEARDKQG